MHRIGVHVVSFIGSRDSQRTGRGGIPTRTTAETPQREPIGLLVTSDSAFRTTTACCKTISAQSIAARSGSKNMATQCSDRGCHLRHLGNRTVATAAASKTLPATVECIALRMQGYGRWPLTHGGATTDPPRALAWRRQPCISSPMRTPGSCCESHMPLVACLLTRPTPWAH